MKIDAVCILDIHKCMGRLMNWNLIPTFLAVVDTGSLSAAGRSLGHSQPTVGRHIADLERQLGVVLFARGARGLVPTEAALRLAEKARPMQAAAADMDLFAQGRAVSLEGTVRVTASEVVATYILPPILRDLLAAEPGMEVEVVASNSTENLALREADIALRMVQPSQSELIVRKLGDLEIGIFAHETYLERAAPVQSPADLPHHVFLGYDRSDLMIRAMGQMGMQVDRHAFRYRTDNQIAHVEAIAAGVGLGAGIVSLLERRAGVHRVLPMLAIPPLPVWLAAHRELITSARVRRVFDFLAERMRAFVKGQWTVDNRPGPDPIGSCP